MVDWFIRHSQIKNKVWRKNIKIMSNYSETSSFFSYDIIFVEQRVNFLSCIIIMFCIFLLILSKNDLRV